MAATFDAILRINAKATGEAEIRRMSGAMRQLEQAGAGVSSALGGIAATVGVVGFAALGQSIARTGIESQQANLRIKALAGSYGEIQGVTDVAARAAKQFALSNLEARDAVANLYGRLRPMGVSLKDVETVFFGVNKAAKLLGLSAFDVNEVMRQLGQALGSGRLQGDELRSVMERMPAVGQAVAKVMGVTVGEIKQLGAEGKITTDVMIRAAAELNKIKPPEPTPFQRFSAAQKDLQQTLGDILLPTLAKITIAANVYAEKVQSFLDRNREGLSRFAKAILDTTSALMPILGRAAAVVIAFKSMQGAIAAVTLAVKAFALISALTPQGLIMLGATAAIGLTAYQKLKGALDDASEGVKGMASNTESAATITERLKSAWNSVSIEASTANEKTEEAKKTSVSLEKLLADQTQETNQRYDIGIQAINRRAAALQQTNSIAAEQNNLQVAQNSLGQVILQNKLALAKTDEEKLAIIKQIAALEQEAARLQYQATMQQIQAERALLQIKKESANKEWEKASAAAQVARNLLEQGRISEAIANKAIEAARKTQAAAAAANNDLRMFNQKANIQAQTANVNMRIAEVRSQGQVQQANTQQVQTTNQPTGQPRYYINTPSGMIPQFAKGAFVTRPTLAVVGEGGEDEYVVPQSKAMSFANNIVAGRRGEQALRPDPFGTERTRAAVAAAAGTRGLSEISKNAVLRKMGWNVTPWDGAIFKGKRPAAIQSVSNRQITRPASTTAAPPIAINIQTGPVIEMDGQKHYSHDDLERAMRATVDAVMGRLRTPYARQALGGR